MSFTPESLPEPVEGTPLPAPIVEGEGFAPPEGVVPPPEPPFPAWRGWDVLGIAVFTAVTIFVFTLIALFVARGLPEFRHSSFIERSRSKEPFGEAIRWNWPGATAPAFIACGVILALVVDGLARFLPIPKSLPMDTYFHDASSAYMMAAFGVTLAPLLEEVFFRGLLYPLLWRAFGLVTGVLLTALAFAGIHGAQLAYAWAPVLSIFVVGIVFTIVRVKTDSVASSFLMHCGYNFALFAALWLASDHYRHLEKVTG
jgi:membrane protease YdiL (CAAX protease family)